MTASIESDPPAAPVAVSFADDPQPSGRPFDAPAVARPPPRRAPPPVARARLVCAWLGDLLVLCALLAGCAALSLRAAEVRYPLDFLRDSAPLWLGLLAALAFSYSWVFTTLAARTPGMALAGLRLRSVHGGAPTPGEALARAALSLPSAALGLFGFLLALAGPRRQTLHDKLCRCLVLVD